jgi:hypothetical protein
VKKAEESQMSKGLFFEKRATSAEGRFLRDMPDRETGLFHKGANTAYPPGIGAALSGSMGGSMNVGTTQGGGGMYGTGKGKKPSEPAVSTPAHPAEKKAFDTTQWMEEGADPVPTGFHRPTREQPEALEFGGERFHSSEAQVTGGVPVPSSVIDHKATAEGLGLPQMKKHANDLRFLGTSFQKQAVDIDDIKQKASDAGETIKNKAGEFGSKLLHSAGEGAKDVVGAGGMALDTVASSPALALGATYLAGRKLLGGAKGVARGAANLVRGRRAATAAKEVGLLGRAAQGVKRALHI